MAYTRFACMHSSTERARQGHAVVSNRYEFAPVEEADAVIGSAGTVLCFRLYTNTWIGICQYAQ